MCVEEALAMSDGPGPEDQESEELDGMPDPEAVAHRADGRPPEEESSDDPMAQAQTILEDSEERTAEGAAGSVRPARPGPPTRIEWTHDGDECVAEVGQPIKWRKPEDYRKRRRVGAWRYGRTVVAIDDSSGPCWMVFLDPAERPDVWANPLLCGDRAKVTYPE